MRNLMIFSLILMALVITPFTFAADTIVQNVTIPKTILDWVKDNWWAALIIIINEILPLLPTKAKSIVTLLWRILVSIFGNSKVKKGL